MKHTIDLTDYQLEQERQEAIHRHALELALKVAQFKRLYYYNQRTDKF